MLLPRPPVLGQPLADRDETGSKIQGVVLYARHRRIVAAAGMRS